MSSITNAEDFSHERHLYWCKELNIDPQHIHRKLFEWTAICDILDKTDVLRVGMNALGFGVGKEPLVSYFASLGIRTVATDHIDTNGVWTDTYKGQAHRDPAIVTDSMFDTFVQYRDVDMNAIPAALRQEQFDFIWSSCSLEHLGSRQHGMNFVKNAMECLVPGGIAVHTTEYTFDAGFDSRDLSFYSGADLKKLQSELEAAGHVVTDLDFTVGPDPRNLIVNYTHFAVDNQPHIRVTLAGRNFTSCLIVIQKRT